MEVAITVDRDSMPTRPARCAGSPSRTRLRSSFTLGGMSAAPVTVTVTATLPWECRGNELRLP